MQTRRGVIAGGAGLFVSACAAAPAPNAPRIDAADRLAEIEARLGGRLGVCAIDTGSGAVIGQRMDERFAMASTFKWLLAAGILKRTESGLSMDAAMYFTPSQLVANSPITSTAIDAVKGVGGLSLTQLCEAAITVSDNTAANLLLVPMFGPEGFTSFMREAGDSISRLDRDEPDLNENAPDDPRDSTTPRAMAQVMREVLTTSAVLKPAQREQLIAWMQATSNARDRLRAGLPESWRAGDKPGTGGHGAHNDVAIAFPPGRKPIVIASYMSESSASDDLKAAAHADVARLVAQLWA